MGKSEWLVREGRPVELQSGTTVKVRIPRLERLIASGQFPDELVAAVWRMAQGNKDQTPKREDFARIADAQDTIIPPMVEAVLGDDDEWEPVEITAEDVAAMPPEDVQDLFDIAMRNRTIKQVTAENRHAQALLTARELIDLNREEGLKTVPGWKSFRDKRSGTNGSGDSEAVAVPQPSGDGGDQ